MDNELQIQESLNQVDSLELLTRFLLKCKNEVQKNEEKSILINCAADLVTAVYYYRRYPNVEDFINKYLKDNKDYFHIQWIRSTWITLSKMTNDEISNLVINQICTVDNSEEEQ